MSRWWEGPPGGRMALVWGRRRVGKTALLGAFAQGRRTVFHTGAGRPARDELRVLSHAAEPVCAHQSARDLSRRPFVDWDDALEGLAACAGDEPLLLVLDEFPELLGAAPELPGVLRAFSDHALERTRLRILLCGSAVRTMQAIQEERAPLYGRIDLALPLHPFAPHEASAMLGKLPGAHARARVGHPRRHPPVSDLVGGAAHGAREPGAAGLPSGRAPAGRGTTRAGNRRRHGRARNAGAPRDRGRAHQARRDRAGCARGAGADAGATDRAAPRRARGSRRPRPARARAGAATASRTTSWRSGSSIVEPYRAEIERGLGSSILSPLMARLDDHMGPRFEEAFRAHLRRLAADGALAPDIVRIGPFWSERPPSRSTRSRWQGAARRRSCSARPSGRAAPTPPAPCASCSARRAHSPRVAPDPCYAVCARERLTGVAKGTLALTAADIFD